MNSTGKVKWQVLYISLIYNFTKHGIFSLSYTFLERVSIQVTLFSEKKNNMKHFPAIVNSKKESVSCSKSAMQLTIV